MADTGCWDRIAARYAKKPIADEGAYERKLEILDSRQPNKLTEFVIARRLG